MPGGAPSASVGRVRGMTGVAMDLLVATDFSPHGKAVLRVAHRFAKALGAKVWIVHVVTPAAWPRLPDADGAAAAVGLEEERRLVEEAASALRLEGVDAAGLTVEGPPVKTLLEEAARLEADMIIVGSHGYGRVARALLGSVSAGLVRQAACPVLVVPVRGEER